MFTTFKPPGLQGAADRIKTRPPAALPRPPKRKDSYGVVGKSSSNRFGRSVCYTEGGLMFHSACPVEVIVLLRQVLWRRSTTLRELCTCSCPPLTYTKVYLYIVVLTPISLPQHGGI